ncbi:SseB family protein [Loigolactobacillus backii]|uniref:Uncharacterized protein n=1 Tax=Loigolactobacillus backii TaxID=375175 RepID=A0A192H4F5_9LACO|nr:enhanced serine sensitivity protein SseB C-terminal domain-containing protein [Loigolactobacillus backii]ANK63255.1 hypothetical protein AYR53_11045 [Loigolactobacillus backii]ANK69739.1 hypothetical protein AYR56_05960 [Loigolactobacillus backii]MDA5386643.1 SseB family protein [Loigolactobacillus backii]MDA5389170.1 SseB family protein [Loigolactobacillus backii]
MLAKDNKDPVLQAVAEKSALDPEKKKATTPFVVRLNYFMENPQDHDLERRFAAMLLETYFRALVKVQPTQKMAGEEHSSLLEMGLAITTYLADGKKYIPVFTDQLALKQFAKEMIPNMDFRTFRFSSAELMTEAQRLGVTGLLVNPGKQTFPLSRDYWQYINQVVPLIAPTNDKLRIELPSLGTKKLMGMLKKQCKHLHKINEVWLANVTIAGHDKADLAVIADYRGEQSEFGSKVARKLALACKPFLEYDQDVLVGNLDDEMGKLISQQFAPIYQATTFFGGRPKYD